MSRVETGSRRVRSLARSFARPIDRGMLEIGTNESGYLSESAKRKSKRAGNVFIADRPTRVLFLSPRFCPRLFTAQGKQGRSTRSERILYFFRSNRSRAARSRHSLAADRFLFSRMSEGEYRESPRRKDTAACKKQSEESGEARYRERSRIRICMCASTSMSLANDPPCLGAFYGARASVRLSKSQRYKIARSFSAVSNLSVYNGTGVSDYHIEKLHQVLIAPNRFTTVEVSISKYFFATAAETGRLPPSIIGQYRSGES